MPLPAVITSTDLVSASHSAFIGPIIISADSDLYVLLRDNAANNPPLAMYKSTDGGDTWAEQDSANAPATEAAGLGSFSVTLDQNDNDLHVAYSNNSGNIEVSTFSTSNDAWGATNNSTVSGPSTVHVSNEAQVNGEWESTNDQIMVGFGSAEKVKGTDYARPKARTYDIAGDAWSGEILLVGAGEQNNYDFRGAVIDSSGRLHCFSSRSDTDELYHITVNPNGTLNTSNVVDSSVNASGAYSVGPPTVYTDSGGTEVVAIPYENTSGTLVLGEAAVADNITSADWSTRTVTSTSVDVSVGPQPVASGSSLVVFWSDSSTTDLFYNVDSGSGFGTDNELRDGVTVASIHTNPNGIGTDTVGLVYSVRVERRGLDVRPQPAS